MRGCFVEVLVLLSAVGSNVNLEMCEGPVRHAHRMHRRSGADWLWLRPDRDARLIPSCAASLVEGELTAKNDSILPACIVCILDHRELRSVFRRLRRHVLVVKINIVPFLVVFLAPIVVEVHAAVHVLHRIPR